MRPVMEPEDNVVHCPFCGAAQVPEEEDYSFWPVSPAAFAEEVHCPRCGKAYTLLCRPAYTFEATAAPSGLVGA